jgi:hypothetical protein
MKDFINEQPAHRQTLCRSDERAVPEAVADARISS